MGGGNATSTLSLLALLLLRGRFFTVVIEVEGCIPCFDLPGNGTRCDGSGEGGCASGFLVSEGILTPLRRFAFFGTMG